MLTFWGLSSSLLFLLSFHDQRIFSSPFSLCSVHVHTWTSIVHIYCVPDFLLLPFLLSRSTSLLLFPVQLTHLFPALSFFRAFFFPLASESDLGIFCSSSPPTSEPLFLGFNSNKITSLSWRDIKMLFFLLPLNSLCNAVTDVSQRRGGYPQLKYIHIFTVKCVLVGWRGD